MHFHPRSWRWLCFGWILLVTGAGVGQAQKGADRPLIKHLADGEQSPAAHIDSLAWLAGHWTGAVFGGEADEIWAPAAGSAMLGMFRHVKEGKVTFLELMVIESTEESLVLRLKHFNRHLVGWEKQDESISFPLVEVAGRVVYFDGLTMETLDEDHITVAVETHDEAGNVGVQSFSYHRTETR